MAETTEHDQAQGRVSTGRARLFALPRRAPAPRWKTSGLTACVVVEREPFEVAPRTTTAEPSYYLSNQTIPVIAPQATVTELAQAIRRPWGVESNQLDSRCHVQRRQNQDELSKPSPTHGSIAELRHHTAAEKPRRKSSRPPLNHLRILLLTWNRCLGT